MIAKREFLRAEVCGWKMTGIFYPEKKG